MNELMIGLMILGVTLYVGSLGVIMYVLWMCRLPSGGVRIKYPADRGTLTDENYK